MTPISDPSRPNNIGTGSMGESGSHLSLCTIHQLDEYMNTHTHTHTHTEKEKKRKREKEKKRKREKKNCVFFVVVVAVSNPNRT